MKNLTVIDNIIKKYKQTTNGIYKLFTNRMNYTEFVKCFSDVFFYILSIIWFLFI